jgi:nucleotidyltransferase/DNA polymerase involved in DNA repair
VRAHPAQGDQSIIERGLAMAVTDPKDYLDRRYENAQIAELPDAPIDALRGLGKAGSETLRKAIGVKTIRDLADNRFVLAA